MAEKGNKSSRPAVIFGADNVTKVGYIDGYIFACEIRGEGHITYPKPRRPKYHLVIIVLEGNIRMLLNGEWLEFGKHSYINLPTWSDLYEISYDKDFHAMVTATDRSVVEDIFRNRNPFPIDFRFTIDHSLGGNILDQQTIDILTRDINNMITSLSNKNHHFAEEINYAYFYILLTDMADMMWKRYGKEQPSHHTEMKRADSIMKEFSQLLAKNILTETEVGFYAEKLCVSRQYLSRIVKEKTRVTIGTVITSMRVETAARLLREPDLSIQQIAEMMSFADQSSFGKFFKKNAGSSPLQYRQRLRKTLLTLR